MTTILTAMCISPALDWFGRSTGPVGVYCAATLAPLGQTEGPVELDSDSEPGDACLLLRFGGVAFRATRCKAPSQWWVLEAIEAAS